MNYAIHRISLDVTDDSPSQLTIAAKQGDTAKILIISLLDDKKNYQIAPNSVAVFIAKKSNGVWLQHPCTIDYQNNKVLYTFQEDTVKSTGTIECEVHLSFSTNVTNEDGSVEVVSEDLTTASFVIAVHETILSGLTDNTEETNLIPDLVSKGSALIAQLETLAIPNAEESTANANAATERANTATANANAAANSVDEAIANANNLVQEVEDKLANGEFDGVSPTHSFEGTVLTMTSASGTTSVDLKGEKGDKGDKGDKGVDAVPTIIPITLSETSEGVKYVNGLDITKRYRIVPNHSAGNQFKATLIEKLENNAAHNLDFPSAVNRAYSMFEVIYFPYRHDDDGVFESAVRYTVNGYVLSVPLNRNYASINPNNFAINLYDVEQVFVYNDEAVLTFDTAKWYTSDGNTPQVTLGTEGFLEGDMCLGIGGPVEGWVWRYENGAWSDKLLDLGGVGGNYELGEAIGTAYEGSKGAKNAQDIRTLYSIASQSGLYAMAEIEQAFTTRLTANGENVVNGSIASLKRIQGSTEIDQEGHLAHATFYGLRVTGKNILRPLSQRVYRALPTNGNKATGFDGKTCTYKLAFNGVHNPDLQNCTVDTENGTITSDFINAPSHCFAMDFPCQAGLYYTASVKDTENRARVGMGFFDKDGVFIENSGMAMDNRFISRQAPANAVWGVVTIGNKEAYKGQITTYSEFMLEVSTAIKSSPSEYEPFVETIISNGNAYELRAFDYIDIEKQVLVRKTGYAEQFSVGTFTEEQLAGYKNYIQALNCMELVYELDEPASISSISLLQKEYVAYNKGTETIVQKEGSDNSEYAMPVVTVEYFKLLGGK